MGWYDTDANAALSRANPAEKVLTPSAVIEVKYLRSVVSPLTSPRAPCGQNGVAAPLPFGGSLYAVTNTSVSECNPATGKLIWRRTLSPTDVYESLAISRSVLIVGGSSSESESEPPGIVYALNASTGARIWSSTPFGVGPLSEAVKVGSYVITEGSDAAGTEVSVLKFSDGKLVWHNDGCNGPVNGPAGLVVGLLVMSYGCQGNQTIEARNLASGALVWSLAGRWALQRGDLSGSAGKHLYVTKPSGTVADLNPQTGKVEYSLSQAVNVLAVDSSRVYATCGSKGKYVCAYNTGTGALEWQNKQLALLNATPALAAEADGVLYLDSGDALNAATGKVIKTLASYNSLATALAVGDGRIAVVSDPRVLDLFGLPGY